MDGKEQFAKRSVVLFDFSDHETISLWKPVNDAVMGGMSRGEMKVQSSTSVLFTGAVSLKNGGGFASIRTLPSSYDLRSFRFVELHVKGDGKTYKLNITDGFDQRGILHQARFETPQGKPTRATIAFDEFQPVFRGTPLPEHQKLDFSNIKTFGLMISDRQEGSFSLEISKIMAVK